MFRGINSITIDGKGRFAIPTRYREILIQEKNSSLIVTIDTEETCLLLYTMTQWHIIETKLQNLPSFNLATRRIQRLLIGHATEITPDAHGRVLLPPLLRDYANVNKSAVMIGQGNKFEIWEEKLWQEKRSFWLNLESSLKETLPEEMQNFSL